MRRSVLFFLLPALIGAPGLAAQGAPTTSTPPVFQDLLRCRALSEAPARLACFDRASAAIAGAAERREVVMVDRAQIKRTKRSLFGLDIPNLSLFGGDDEEAEVKSIEAKIRSAHVNSDGRWIVMLDDGSAWQQTDRAMLGVSPRAGGAVVINRTVVGSYMMRVSGQPGIRVRRQK